jgi:hypothetical protein
MAARSKRKKLQCRLTLIITAEAIGHAGSRLFAMLQLPGRRMKLSYLSPLLLTESLITPCYQNSELPWAKWC